MEKLKKLLLKLSQQEREKLEGVMISIIHSKFDDLDVKKLKGHSDIFRVRVGKMRVIFTKRNNKNLILEVSRRKESTYRKF